MESTVHGINQEGKLLYCGWERITPSPIFLCSCSGYFRRASSAAFFVLKGLRQRRHVAIYVFAATLLCARKLMEMGDRPSPAKFALVEDAISDAKFILDRIDKKCGNGADPVGD
jgi:hypothetical protein